MCGKTSAGVVGAPRRAEDRPPRMHGDGSPAAEVIVRDLQLENRELCLGQVCRGFGFDEIRASTAATSSIQFVGGTRRCAHPPQRVQTGPLDRTHARPYERPCDRGLVRAAARKPGVGGALAQQPQVQTKFRQGAHVLGTAFAIVPGNASVFVTASHVAARCVGGSMGAGDASVAITRDDVTHDVAVLQETDGGPPVVPRALGLNTAAVRVGESVALIGYPVGPPSYPGKVGRPLVAVLGTVLATGRQVTLPGENGTVETLSGAIEVSGGVGPGASGGPAIDATGSVVGVIEGGNQSATYLTPAAAIGASSAPSNGSLPTLVVGSWSGMKPTTIDFSGDAGNVVTSIVWSSWTATQAVGQGTSVIQGCVPNCAQGSNTPVATTITLSKPAERLFHPDH